ncbi:MAG: OmpH family outer membrane protein [Candidatus Competibacterales bacterium]
MCRLLIVSVGLMASCFVAAQNLKIGVVNITKILDEAPQAQVALSRIEREFAPRNQGLTDARRSLRSLEEQLRRDGAIMSDDERRRLERDILAQRREISRSMSEFQEDIALRRNEELTKLQRVVRQIITQLAQEQRFDLIVHDLAVIHVSPALDITDEVLERLK